MKYELDDIKRALGKKFNEDHDYILARSADVLLKQKQGWVLVGTVPDTTEAGVMKIMGRPKEA